MSIPAERHARIAEVEAEYGPDTNTENEETLPERYLVIERSTYDRSIFLTTHDTPAAASDYLAGQECPEDWAPQALVDLDTGTRFYPELQVIWHEVPAR